ncbi:Glutamyl-Q tRNA(Asp) synthetase [hydrothermal vent metagenome]|uniref:Glutamyl-Q tRNA(Asp) synthetase n=1 Tax=hydrothermal vent metagenome TaxID=652676 RepID=A0A3B0T1H1_9ZZZZ
MAERVLARPVLRFAPSPNGHLHLGHAYSALFTAQVAKALGARVLLRIEDIDLGRSREAFVTAIFEDLAWLGLEWEEPVRHQSAHLADYRAAVARLRDLGLLYPSLASRKDIAGAVTGEEGGGQSWPRDPDGAPHYPRRRLAARDTGPGPRALRLDASRAIASAPQLDFEEIGPNAAPSGVISAAPEIWGDALLARKDIGTSYHVSVVVDDARQGITHVTRGADLAPATHLHRLLQHCLGLPTPVYCHHPLLLDEGGQKLAKSAGSKSLRDLRAEGETPHSLRAACGIDRLTPFFERLAASAGT